MRCLLILLLLSGCAGTKFPETTCTATVTLHIADTYESSSNARVSGKFHPQNAFRNNTLAASNTYTGEVWVIGTKWDDGVRVERYEDVGHEVMHIMSSNCPDKIANPDIYVGLF